MATLPAVVLAAGGSTRMGRPKALVELPDGATALARIVAACQGGGCAPVLVVVGSDADAVGAAARAAGAEVIENGAWARGRSTSVKAALPHLPAGAAGFLLFPVDHPLVEAPVVRALLEAFAAASPGVGLPPGARRVPGDPDVVLPVHGGRRGHPVVLAARVFPEVVALGPDQPLRDVVHRPGRVVVEVPVDTDTVHRNLDTPGDLPG